MSTWAGKRKLIYASIFVTGLILILGVPSYIFLYNPPSCDDGKKNGTETGVDCGGSCERICQVDFLPPLVGWSRFERVAPGLYNVATYVINQNSFGEAQHVPFHMALYDSEGTLIVDKSGTMTIPPHRNTLAFIGAVPTGERKPAKVFFEFKSAPLWQRSVDRLQGIKFDSGAYNEDSKSSSLAVSIENTTQEKISGLAVHAVLKDGTGNAIGFSKTYIDEVPAKSSAMAPFTWAFGREGKVVSVEILPVLE